MFYNNFLLFDCFFCSSSETAESVSSPVATVEKVSSKMMILTDKFRSCEKILNAGSLEELLIKGKLDLKIESLIRFRA